MLEILTEHYMASSFKGEARGLILGAAGIDLRFIGIWAREPSEEPDDPKLNRDIALHHALNEIDLEKLDREVEFNGDHSFFDKNPDYSGICRAASVQQLRNALKSGADVNARDSRGKTPLMHVVYNPDFMKVLIEAGADINAKDEDGRTALMHTAYAQTDDPTVVEMLVEAEADIDARDEDDRTALMLAAERSRTEIAKVLLHFGANVNEQDKDGKTALMYAVKQQNSWQGSSDPELIDVLLETEKIGRAHV